MRNLRNRNRDLLINELNQGKELANQLRFYLSPSCPNGEVLIRQLQSSFNKAIVMLNCNQAEAETKLQDIVKESLRLVSGSPQSHVSEYKDICRKRKILPWWTEQVRGSPEMGLEEPEDDGYGWRKYGQKDILGAKYLRGYYRCTHRNAHGCMATKQVQRSNKNPLIFDITYRGKHTCIQAYRISPTSELPIKQEQRQGSKKARHSEEIFINFAADPEDITSNFNTYQISPFSFPSTLSMETKLKNKNVSSFHPDKNTMDNCSRQFMSPTSSETNYLSPSPMNNSFGSASIFTNSDCSPTSSSKFSAHEYCFAYEATEFDPNLFFDDEKFRD